MALPKTLNDLSSSVPSALSKSFTPIELEFVQQYLSKDLNKIIYQCFSFDINEKTSGLCNLHILLRRKDVILSEKEVIKIRDILAHFFQEENSKIYRIFLEVLYDFLQLFSNFLTEWIVFIFLKLFTKLGSNILPSLKKYIKKLLVSLNFCYTPRILFQSFCQSYSNDKFTSSKTKSDTAALEYLQELLRFLEPDDFMGTHYMESFIVKLTKELAFAQYTMRKKIQDILSVLYDLNPATFNCILNKMQNNLQETLTRSMRSHWAKVIENDSLSPRKTFPSFNYDYSLNNIEQNSGSEHHLSKKITPLTSSSCDYSSKFDTKSISFSNNDDVSLSLIISNKNSIYKNINTKQSNNTNTIRNRSNTSDLIDTKSKSTNCECSTPSKIPKPVYYLNNESTAKNNSNHVSYKSNLTTGKMKIDTTICTNLTPSKIPIRIRNDQRLCYTPNPKIPRINTKPSNLMHSYSEYKNLKPKNIAKLTNSYAKISLNFDDIKVNKNDDSNLINETNNDQFLESDFTYLPQADVQTNSHANTDSTISYSYMRSTRANGLTTKSSSNESYIFNSSRFMDVRQFSAERFDSNNIDYTSVSGLLSRLLVDCSDDDKLEYVYKCRNEIISLLVGTSSTKQLFIDGFLNKIQSAVIDYSYRCKNEELLMSLHLIYLVSILENDSLVLCTDKLIHLVIHSHTISSYNVKLKIEELFQLVLPYTCLDILVKTLMANLENITSNSLNPLKFVLLVIKKFPYDQLIPYLPSIAPLLVDLFSDKVSIQNAVLPCLVALLNKYESFIQKYIINLSQEQIRLIKMYANV